MGGFLESYCQISRWDGSDRGAGKVFEKRGTWWKRAENMVKSDQLSSIGAWTVLSD